MTITRPWITKEKLGTTADTSANPSATPPQWAITKPGITPDEADWVDGEWTSDWVATTGRIRAASPTLGGGTGAQIPLTRGTYAIWVRWAVGSEQPPFNIGELTLI